MAATVAVLGTSVFTTTAGDKTVTATPAVGDLIVVVCASSGLSGGPTAVTDNQSGTYTQVDVDRTGFSTTGTLCVWVRTALIPAASSTIFTSAQSGSTGGGLIVYSVSGMTLTGASAVRSSGGQSTGTSGTTPAPVLSLTPLSSNPIIMGVANGTNGSTTVTPRTGYTEDRDSGYATPATGFETSHIVSGETSATLTMGSTTASAFASIAIELQYNSAPTVALNTPTDTATGVSTTPDLAFTGTDADSDTIEYNVQVDAVNTFDSQGSSPAFVQSKSADSAGTTGTTASVTPTSTPTSGNLLYVAITQQSTTGRATMSGWTELTGAHADGTSTTETHLQSFYKISDGTESTISATLSISANWVIAFAEYSGISASPLDIDNANLVGASGSTTTAYTTPTVTPTASANRLIITAYQGRTDTATWSSEQINSSTTGVTEREDRQNSSHLATLAIADKLVASTSGTYQGSATAAAATFGGASIAIFKANKAPLLNKLSVTPDATFTDVTNGAHTHPFVSGEQIKYTVQAGDVLTASTTYYWRVAGTDPSGTNTYGAWATTRSFTTASAVAAIPNKVININQAVNRSGNY